MKTLVTLNMIVLFLIMASVADAQVDCACPKIFKPVCGDNGEDYDNACFAECAGIKVLYEGECVWKWVDYPLESPHPYPNNYVEKWLVQPPEKTPILRLSFLYIATQKGRDFLEFHGDDGLLDKRSGVHILEWLTLHTNSATLRLITDRNVRGWGFEMLGYEYLALPAPNPCEEQGGMCIPVVPGATCDDGYRPDPDVACRKGTQCCMPCVKEGGQTMPPYNCCDGLSPVSDCLPGEPCPISLRYCVACGNGTCDKHENQYNCAADCRDTSCDDGTEPLCDMIPPICESGEILAYQSHCYLCVDPYTCAPTQWCGGEDKIPCSEMKDICWYQTGDEKFGRCHKRIGDVPVCRAIGTRSEGWYFEESGDLINYAFCNKEMPACFLESGNKSQGWYTVGEGPAGSALIVWDVCHR